MKPKLFLLFSFLLSISAHAADGDTLRTLTVEGVSMSFKILSETEKTVQVGASTISSAVSSNTAGTVTIPETVSMNGIEYSVVTVGINAFSGCKEITQINMPNSITKISFNAFKNCEGLTVVEIPRTVRNIGSNIFLRL